MRKALIKRALINLLALALLSAGCASTKPTSPGDAMNTVATVAATAPLLAQQLDSVYAFLVAQKAVPDHLDAATKALAALDAIAPTVQKGAEALSGDKFNWTQFVVQSALVVAQAMGYILPLVV